MPGAGAPGGSFRFEDIGDLGDVLAACSAAGGAAPARGPGPGRGTGPMRGHDQEAELHLGFDDAVQGITTTST